MSEKYKLSTKLVLKVSDDLNSYADRHVVIYRGQGPWTNPDTWSLPGVDGVGEDALINGTREKFGLETNISDWQKLAEVPNPANNEINHLWLYERPLKESDLSAFFKHVAGVEAMPLSALWKDRADHTKRMSPALETIMQAALVSDNDGFRTLFKPAMG